MAQSPPLDRLTASDIFLMLWDDYGWATDIGALAILDGRELLDPDGRLRLDDVRRVLEPRLALVPRFRQLLYRPSAGLGWPLWVDAPSFDITHHVRMRPLAAPAGEAELLRACEEIAGRRLDPGRPLWELWLLPGLPGDRVGALVRLHHAMADGAAAMAAFGALMDGVVDPREPARSPTPSSIPSSRRLLVDNVRRRTREMHGLVVGLRHPARTARRVVGALPAWKEVLTEARAPRTSLNRPVGRDRRLALVRTRLDVTKRIGHAHGAKVNDVVLTAVAGGLRELLRGRGEPVDGLMQRAMVTISLHDEGVGQARGNRPGWMMVPLPVGEPDAVRRLRRIASETRSRKRRPRPAAGSGIFRFVIGQRVWYRMFPRQRSVNVVVTNAPGPVVPLHLAGAELLETFPMMPVMGNLTLVVAVLSYAGQLNLTAVADRERCPDLDEFVRGVRQTFDELVASSSGPPEPVPPSRADGRLDVVGAADGAVRNGTGRGGA
jgi:diacylglycerol O-acyltransferase / wax synthase